MTITNAKFYRNNVLRKDKQMKNKEVTFDLKDFDIQNITYNGSCIEMPYKTSNAFVILEDSKTKFLITHKEINGVIYDTISTVEFSREESKLLLETIKTFLYKEWREIEMKRIIEARGNLYNKYLNGEAIYNIDFKKLDFYNTEVAGEYIYIPYDTGNTQAEMSLTINTLIDEITLFINYYVKADSINYDDEIYIDVFLESDQTIKLNDKLQEMSIEVAI